MIDLSEGSAGTARNAWRRLAGRPGSLRFQVVQGTVGTGLLRVAHRLIQLGTSILLARMLGTHGYGVYAYAVSIVTLLSVPGQVGLPKLVVREVATYQEAGQTGLTRGLLKRTAQASLVLALFTMMLGGLFAVLVRARVDALDLATFSWAIALIPLSIFAAVRAASLRGLHHVVLGQLPETLIRPLAFLALTAASFVFLGSVRPDQAMMYGVLAAALGFMSGLWLLWRKLPPELKQARPEYEDRKWLARLAPFTLLAGIQVINSSADILMLGVFSPSGEVGIYRVATMGAALVALPLFAANSAIAPKVASLFASGDHVRLQRLMTTSARYLFSLTLPFTMALVLYGETILETVFGVQFGRGGFPMAILSLAQLVNVAAGSVVLFLNMTGHEGRTARVLGVVAILNIVLNAILIPPYGMTGAALATATTVVSWNVCLAWMVKRSIGIRPGI